MGACISRAKNWGIGAYTEKAPEPRLHVQETLGGRLYKEGRLLEVQVHVTCR